MAGIDTYTKLMLHCDGIDTSTTFTDDSDSEDIIRFFVPENLQNAIFNGASVIGSLQSFQNFFITSGEFRADANILYRDISDIFK